jgi:hypothetical protein
MQKPKPQSKQAPFCTIFLHETFSLFQHHSNLFKTTLLMNTNIRVENDKETFRPFSKKKETKSKKRKRKRYYAEKKRKRNILNGNGRGNG